MLTSVLGYCENTAEQHCGVRCGREANANVCLNIWLQKKSPKISMLTYHVQTIEYGVLCCFISLIIPLGLGSKCDSGYPYLDNLYPVGLYVLLKM